MAKIVMPKNSALLDEIEAVLKIYYEANDWMSNDDYKKKLKSIIGDDQYASSYTKKAQITSYFGFTVWQDINNARSLRRITNAGKEMYEALCKRDDDAVWDILLRALETVTFGRNNYGCPDSNSDVEPPSVFIRAILDLGYFTYKEFAYTLWKLEDCGGNYTDTLDEIRQFRSDGKLELNEEAAKYTDCKPIMILNRWGFLDEVAADNEEKGTGGTRIVIKEKVRTKYYNRLKALKIYNIDMDLSDAIVINETTDSADLKGINKLFYGVPGSGKSHSVDQICSDKARMERVVFHPEYTYSDFVGQIMPQIADDGKTIEYKFVEGPFTRILQTAYKEENRNTTFYLVIEEINRGNAPAIFGDIFQLLDRDETGASKYGIKNMDVAEKVFGKENKLADIKIPGNVTILATMNTSDQNVFTLDTAFQRRWEMVQVTNRFKPDHEFADKTISDTSVTWRVFNETVNELIVRKNPMASTEDKRLGTYFIKAEDLSVGNRNFPEKVIKYLWDDAVKFKRDIIFNDKDYPTLEDVIEHFENSTMDERLRIFADGLFKVQKNNISTNNVVDEELEDTESQR